MKRLFSLQVLMVISIMFSVDDSDASRCDAFKRYVEQYTLAIHHDGHLPQGNIQHPEHAYLIQKCVIEHSRHRIVGYKAGLMNARAQHRFDAREPVFGVLQAHHVSPAPALQLKPHRVFLAEAELAMKLKTDITNLKMLNDVLSADMKSFVDSVALAIEIADFNFRQPQTVNARDISAANVGAAHVYVGEFANIEQVELGQLKMTFVSPAQDVADEIMLPVDYETQLKWFIRKAYLEGYALKKDMVLLGGSLSPLQPVQPGEYRLKSKNFGVLSLVVHQGGGIFEIRQ